MKRLRAALPLILLLAAGAALYASGVLNHFDPRHLVANQDALHALVAAHPWASRLLYIGLLAAGAATGLPGILILTLAGGFAFGVLDGTLYGSAGLILGSLILYLASRHAFASGTRAPPPLAARLHHGYEAHPVSYTLFLRFVPVMPFGAVSIGLAWLRCPWRLFLLATWLGGTTSLLFETSVGAGLGTALREDGRLDAGLLLHAQVLWPMGAIAALTLLPLLIQRIKRHRRRPP